MEEIVKLVIPFGEINGFWEMDEGNFNICSVCAGRVFYLVPRDVIVADEEIYYKGAERIDCFCAECGAGPYSFYIQRTKGDVVVKAKDREDYLRYLAGTESADALIAEAEKEES